MGSPDLANRNVGREFLFEILADGAGTMLEVYPHSRMPRELSAQMEIRVLVGMVLF